jgi:signal transduction histidine kinase
MITNFKLFNQTVEIGTDSPLKQNITETDEIILSHRQNFLTFEFSAFNYVNSRKNQYKYMMEGVNTDWVDAGNQRFADYQGLSPGKYTFKVIGSNNDGIWNLEGDRLGVIIRPPWWASVPAYLLYIILIVLFIFGYIRFRTKRLIRHSRELESQVVDRTRQISLQKEEIETQKNILEELNASKDKLFRIVAHDLKNPMTALLSITNSLNFSYHQLEERDKEESVKQANKAAEDLHRLLENLLQWTTSQTGKLKIEAINFDLSRLANENISLAETSAKRKKISVTSTVPEGCVVYADRNMISTVLRNLLSNSIKFTPSGGKISLSVSEVKDGQIIIFYKLTVADSGIGIPKEKIDQLFQVDGAWTTKGTANESGTGLGLMICRDFVKRNCGEIELESSEEEGSRFSFTLPVGSLKDK